MAGFCQNIMLKNVLRLISSDCGKPDRCRQVSVVSLSTPLDQSLSRRQATTDPRHPSLCVLVTAPGHKKILSQSQQGARAESEFHRYYERHRQSTRISK